MTSELSRKVNNILAREMGQLGKFIVKKQCNDNGIDPDNITIEDLQTLAGAFKEVMLTFGGSDKARKVEREIRKLASE